MTSSRWERALDGRDAYEILGVAPAATVREINQAKRSRLSAAHPDAGAKSDHLAKLITSAAAILLDENERREYDRWRTRTPPGHGRAPDSPYRGTGPPRPPRPVPGPGPGAPPMYGSPNVMPHLGQPPPQFYHQPTAPRSRTGLVVLAILGGVLLLCLGVCLLNGLLLR